MAPHPADRALRQRIEAIFEEAIALPPPDRVRVVEARCGGDDRLRAEVDALIAAHEHAAGILELNVAAAAAAALPDRSRDRRIGSYRVLRELGRGGMGVVYLAERDDGQYQQHVAIKVLHTGPDDHDRRQRFLSERQILASLTHPGIARLLDGGIAEGRLPYLVMEYVDGAPITTHCNQHALGIHARLQLFLEVCAAVHHAHCSLVIHRDLKPGNILVSRDGRVKLLDFGVAKLLDPAAGPRDLPPTRAGLRAMTPEYASPEQVRGEPLTTASDVYALGILLYELLAGQRPYEFPTGSARELMEVVCSLLPERPSLVAARWGPTLRGDLDAIVMKALRKVPADRYGSAEQLRQDLQRYLDGLPVLAHRGSRLYRARKFFGRHRVEAAAVAAVMLSLAAGVGIALRQASVAARERDRAEQARAEAEQSLKQSESVTSFLVGLYDANVAANRGGAVTASDLLRRGAEQVEALRRQPLEQARMLEAMGRVHAAMARYPEARAQLERSLDRRIARLGPNHPEVARTLYYLIDVLRRMGEYARADSLSGRAIAIRIAAFGPEHPATAELLAQRAFLFVYRSNLPGAEALSRRALDIRRRTLPPNDPLIAASLDVHAAHLMRLGRSAAAEAELREAIEVRRSADGGDSPDVAMLALRLGSLVLDARGDTTQAESLMRSGLAIMRTSLGEEHRRTAWAMSELAGLLSLRGRHQEAEQLARTAVEAQRKTFGAGHVFVADLERQLVDVYMRAGRWTDAARVQRETLTVWEQTFGRHHTAYADALVRWAEVLTGLGRHAEAIEATRRAIDIRRRRLGEGGTTYGLDVARLARIYARQGNYTAADSLFRIALTSQSRYAPETHPDIREIYGLMSERYALAGQPREAEQFGRRAQPH